MKASSSEPLVRRRDPAIVLIADHVDARRTLHVETLLFLSDYRIVEAIDARGVIERARRLRPRVLVMPASLPGMEPGSGAIWVLKEDPAMRDVRTIILADRDDQHAELLAGELGADVLLHEPFLPPELVNHVRRCVGAGARSQPQSSDPRKRPSDRMEADRKRPSERMEVERKRPSERMAVARRLPSETMAVARKRPSETMEIERKRPSERMAVARRVPSETIAGERDERKHPEPARAGGASPGQPPLFRDLADHSTRVAGREDSVGDVARDDATGADDGT